MTTDDTYRRELEGLEPLFHRLRAGATKAEVAALTDEGFFEVGASGSRYDRDFVIETVARRYADGTDPDPRQWSVSDFDVRAVGQAVYLVTYLLDHGGSRSWRSTLWARSDLGWSALYHQGTVNRQMREGD